MIRLPPMCGHFTHAASPAVIAQQFTPRRLPCSHLDITLPPHGLAGMVAALETMQYLL